MKAKLSSEEQRVKQLAAETRDASDIARTTEAEVRFRASLAKTFFATIASRRLLRLPS